jgi:hypothetical protein
VCLPLLKQEISSVDTDVTIVYHLYGYINKAERKR